MNYIFSDIFNDFSHIISVFVVLLALLIYLERFQFICRYPSSVNYFFPFVIIILFVLSVVGNWYNANSSHVAISGFLPWNDANGYFNCAHSFLDTGKIDSFCQRRPIYSFYLASLLGIAGRDLHIVLVIQAVLLGIAVYFFSSQLKNNLGKSAAFIIFSFLFLFAAETSNTTLTENAGFLFGLLGLIYLWDSSNRDNLISLALGTLLLTLALNARAGAYFVLPAALLWAFLFMFEKWQMKIKAAVIVFCAICLGFLLNSGLLLAVGGDQKMSNANFSYVIYGVTAGGKGWTYVYDAEPEIFSEGGNELTQSRKIYEAAFRNLIDKPYLFVQGYYRGLINYFDKINRFVRVKPYRISLLWIFFTGLWVVGLATVLLNIRRDKRYSLIAILAIGVIISAPIITFDGRSRIYAATIPIDSVIIGIGFLTLIKILFQQEMSWESVGDYVKNANLFSINIFTAIIFVILLPAPWLIKSWAALPALPDKQCDNGLTSIVLRPGLESPMVKLTDSDENVKLYPLSIPISSFRKGLQDKAIHLDKELSLLNEGNYLLWGYQRSERNFGVETKIIWPDNNQVVKKGDVVHLCTKLNSIKNLPGFASVETYKILNKY